MEVATIQLGKQGITENFLETLRGYFIRHTIVKVIVLRAAGHEKSEMQKYSEEILAALGPQYTARTIGFTIIVRKWRKIQKPKKGSSQPL